MERLEKLREYNIIRKIVAFEKTGWFFVLLGVMSVLGCLLGLDMAVFYIAAVIGLFTVIINDDIKTILPVLVFPYFASSTLGRTTVGGYFGYTLAQVVQVAVLISVVIIALIVRLAMDGKLKGVFKQKTALRSSALLVIIALVLNGFVSSLRSDNPWGYIGSNLLSGLLLSLCLFGGYFIFTHALRNDKNNISYFCRLLAALGATILIQLFITALIAYVGGSLIREDSAFFIMRGALALGWGTYEIIAGMLLVCLPATLYITLKYRLPLFSYGLALLCFAGIVLTQCRAAIYIGCAVLAGGTVLCCFKGRNKAFCRYFLFALVGIMMVLFSYLGDRTPSFFIRVLAADQSWFAHGGQGGVDTWAEAWKAFASEPFFGAGFSFIFPSGIENGIGDGANMSMFAQVAAASGVLGLLAFVYHAGQVLLLFVRRMSAERYFIALLIGAIILCSMLSNYMFYPQFAIIYSLLLALSERDSDFRREKALAEHKYMVAPGGGRKPRVVFTYVEAGLGHIMSIKAVAEAFEAKYGDRVEVIHSQFFTETGDADLAAVQEYFAAVVKKQNEIKGFGGLMMFAAKVVGEWISHTATMLLSTKSGLKALPKAVRHIDELNADILFTTHWATTYYAGKSKHRPFVMTLCPDMKTNIMFRMDSNYSLISTKQGYDDMLRIRRYNGNNVKLVSRPIRKQAYEYENKKTEVRAKLGIDSGAFVVLLADGGYGLSKMLTMTRLLLKSNKKMTVMPVAGLSNDVYEKLLQLKPNGNIDYRPYGYSEDMLSLIAASDVFVGKSGACLASETYFYGVPQIITNVATPIERDIMKYCRDTLGCGIYQPNVEKAAALVEHYASQPRELEPLSRNATTRHEPFGGEEIADMIYSVLEKQGKVGPFYDDYGETLAPPPPPSFPKMYWLKVARELRERRKNKKTDKKIGGEEENRAIKDINEEPARDEGKQQVKEIKEGPEKETEEKPEKDIEEAVTFTADYAAEPDITEPSEPADSDSGIN